MTRRIILVDIGTGLTLTGVLPSVALDAAYSARLIARGGSAPYTYTVVSGAAELAAAGLYLDPATGIISGTAAVAGTIALTIRATDLTGASVQRQFAITVIAEPKVLTLTGTFADATVGTPYSSDLQITNGVAPYTLHDGTGVISGSLPAGLSLSIVGDKLRLSGTPTMEATSNFIVAVDSGDGQTETSAQSIAVAGADPIAVSIYNKMSAYWDLAEATGNRIESIHGGSGLDLVPTSVTTATGPRGGTDICANFNGTSSVLAVQPTSAMWGPLDPQVANLSPPPSYSLFGWVYLNSAPAYAFLAGRWNAAGYASLSYNFDVRSGVVTGVTSKSGGYAVSTMPASTGIGAWHFVKVDYDAAAGKFGVSVDGSSPIWVTGGPGAYGLSQYFSLGAATNPGGGGYGSFAACRMSRFGFARGGYLDATETTWMINSGAGRNWSEIKTLAGH